MKTDWDVARLAGLVRLRAELLRVLDELNRGIERAETSVAARVTEPGGPLCAQGGTKRE